MNMGNNIQNKSETQVKTNKTSKIELFTEMRGTKGSSGSGSGSGSVAGGGVTKTSDGSDDSSVANITWSTVDFENGDKSNHCYATNDKYIKVIASGGTHDHGSSNVKLKNVVDYKWEVKNYPGHLIAVHMDGKHIAYAIIVSSKKEGMVRVLDRQTNSRTLIKGMTGEVLDLQFAYIEKERILGCIDINSLFVHKIEVVEGNLVPKLLIKVEDPISDYLPKHDKIAWCPFVEGTPEDGDEYDDDSHLLVWSRGSTYQCFNVKQIIAENGYGNYEAKSLQNGYQRFYDPAITITWVTISPDASTLAAGCSDGMINFYQVYLHAKDPRCLHHWSPHGGKPISSLFFLDDLTTKKNKYWKFAVTGAVNNTEIKVWDCDSWACLQTVNFTVANDIFPTPHFIAEIDHTSKYLVLSCLETRTCYVMQVGSDEMNSFDAITADDKADSKKAAKKALALARSTRIRSIAEFPLSSVVLSFSIVNAAVRRYKCGNDSYMMEEMDDFEEETNSVYCVVVSMFLVQSKSMQECRILYQPTVSITDDVKSTLSPFSSVELNTTIDSLVTSDSNKSKGSVNGVKAADTKKVKKEENKDDDDEDDLDEEDEVDDEGNANNNDEDLSSEPNNANDLSPDDESEEDIKFTIRETNPGSANMLEALLNITSKSNNTSRSNSSIANAMKDDIKKTDSSPQQMAGAISGKRYGQVNLMTPDAFSAAADKRTPEGVSTEVMNTILMLAGAASTNVTNAQNSTNTQAVENQSDSKAKCKKPSKYQKKFGPNDNRSAEKNENPPSGASSPSREVREIMSLTDSYSGDELQQNSTDINKISANEVSVTTLPGATASNNSNSSNVKSNTWPMPLDTSQQQQKQSSVGGIYSDEFRNAAQIMSQAVKGASPNAHVPPTFGSSAGLTASTSDLNGLNQKMDHLIELVKNQTVKINAMQKELSELKKSKEKAPPKSMSEMSYKLEMSLSKLLEQYLQRFENEHNKKFAVFSNGRDAQTREIREYFLQVMNQYLINQVGDIVGKRMVLEIQHQLAPIFVGKIDHLHQQIQLDLAQKMAAINHMLQESVSHVCSNKNVIDTFGKSVCAGIQNSMQNVFVESMRTTLVPAYELSSQNMFKELSDAFTSGLQEFVGQLDRYIDNMKPMHKSNEDIVKTLEALRYYIDASSNGFKSSVGEIQQDIMKEFKSMEILILRQVQETVRVEVRKSLDCSATMAAIRSQANTPAPALYDAKESIKQMLMQGQINKAFHQALLANDLNLVEFTLKSVDHNDVFIPECCLEQKVLLSLIQQISADMSRHNEIKQNYLNEAIIAVNLSDPISREHAPKVLQELMRNCQTFLLNYPKNPLSSHVRMIVKTIQSFHLNF